MKPANSKELEQHLANAMEICEILGERLKTDPKDIGAALCLGSAQEEVRVTMLKLKQGENDTLDDGAINSKEDFVDTKSYAFG